MRNSRIENIRNKVRNMGYALAQAELRGLRGEELFAKKLAHNLLLGELYSLEKRV